MTHSRPLGGPAGAQAAFDAALRADFNAFLTRAFRELCPGDKLDRTWHLEAIAHRLTRVSEASGSRLIVNVPPRSLKSLSISVAWVAWMLGRYPHLRFICVSYAQDLALKHARDCRTLMSSAWYQRIFPRTVLKRSAEQDLETTQGGGRRSTSIGGTLTGLGGHIMILDDPHKADEVASKARRQEVTDWYVTNASTRLDDKTKGSVVVVMQRLHEMDLSGHLLAAGGWDHLCLPARADRDEAIPIGLGKFHHRKEGDLLQPAREPQGVLDQLRATMGSVQFEAQYQQAPVPVGGLMIQKDWLTYYDIEPTWQPGDKIVQSWDCANKDGAMTDYSACVTALIRKRQIYVLDVFRKRMAFPELMKAVEARAEAFEAKHLLVEDAASGQQLIQMLRHEGKVIRPLAIVPKGDKESRVSGASARIENGEVLLPKQAAWRAEFERELLSFPGGEFDDQVDALAQLINWDIKSAGRLPLPGIAELINEWGQTVELDDYGNLIVTDDMWRNIDPPRA